jgi:hypothetical protein
LEALHEILHLGCHGGFGNLPWNSINFRGNSASATVQEIIAPGQVPDLVQVASKTSEKNGKKRRNFNSGFSYLELGIIPGHVPTPYGYRDCIGSWHLHANGHIHCHGQLIREF